MTTFLEPGRSRSPSKQYKFEWKFGQRTINPQIGANSCSSELPFNVNNYSCPNLAPLLQLLPSRFTLRFSFCFQRYLTTQGVTVIALAQMFNNVGDT